MKARHAAPSKAPAFTLIEILIVVAIMSVLLAMAGMSAGGMMESIRMRDAIETTRYQFESARQTAMTKNVAVIIRIYKQKDQFNNPVWNSVEYGTADIPMDPGESDYQNPEVSGFNVPLKKLGTTQKLPEGFVFHPEATFSSLLAANSAIETGSDEDENGQPREYISVACHPEGRMNLPTTEHWTITVVKATDLLESPNTLPANFTTLELDPSTARIRVYRP